MGEINISVKESFKYILFAKLNWIFLGVYREKFELKLYAISFYFTEFIILIIKRVYVVIGK